MPTLLYVIGRIQPIDQPNNWLLSWLAINNAYNLTRCYLTRLILYYRNMLLIAGQYESSPSGQAFSGRTTQLWSPDEGVKTGQRAGRSSGIRQIAQLLALKVNENMK